MNSWNTALLSCCPSKISLLARVTCAAMDTHLSLHLAQKAHIGHLRYSYLVGIYTQTGRALLQENPDSFFRESSRIIRTHELQHLIHGFTGNLRIESESFRRDLGRLVRPLSNK